jgi:DNA transformation protein
MPCSPSFVDHAIDLLASVGPVEARRMFGGYGAYARGVMFGLLDDDELFLKTDAESRPRFVSAGCRMWIYPGAGKGETSYYRPPDEAHEDAEAMAPWARLGLDAALRLRAAKAAEAAARESRRAAKLRTGRRGPPARKPASPAKAAPGPSGRTRRRRAR